MGLLRVDMKFQLTHSHPDITNNDIQHALCNGVSKIRIDFICDNNTIMNSCLLSLEEAKELKKCLSYSIDILTDDRKRFGYK